MIVILAELPLQDKGKEVMEIVVVHNSFDRVRAGRCIEVRQSGLTGENHARFEWQALTNKVMFKEGAEAFQSVCQPSRFTFEPFYCQDTPCT
jgi:hypothetical protein